MAPPSNLGKRVKGTQVCRPFIYGTTAIPFGPENPKPPGVPDDHTHSWQVFVKGLDDTDVTYWLRRIQFKLHESIPNHVRMIDAEPGKPFVVNETGWGEFEITLKLYYATESGEKPQTLYHHLRLHPYGRTEEEKEEMRTGNGEVRAWIYEDQLFSEPYETFYEILTSGAHPKGHPGGAAAAGASAGAAGAGKAGRRRRRGQGQGQGPAPAARQERPRRLGAHRHRARARQARPRVQPRHGAARDQEAQGRPGRRPEALQQGEEKPSDDCIPQSAMSSVRLEKRKASSGTRRKTQGQMGVEILPLPRRPPQGRTSKHTLSYPTSAASSSSFSGRAFAMTCIQPFRPVVYRASYASSI
ncbi:YEATS domain-containing protein [Verticillium alfalfae VaMs.102]|uniref:Protein AF-9 homolog n=1 Tax=Verticillium alfalfae (strain VaMs.102 / ATCC MYA-4576 / FGSC 10136) TaxID=526221 RepID=C9SVJ4_VERA1|nr:YEATS domain-containing protein [Verticillium alfalfae VaMs.102]EEY22809.1 YEATS domain-containing protein [Verticillium alfalfae VaMs.102]